MIKNKILFLIDSLTCGGAEKSLVSLLPLLDFSQVEVDLMLYQKGGVFEQYVPKEVQILDFPHRRTFRFRLSQYLFSIMLRFLSNRHSAEVRWMVMSSSFPSLEKQYDVAIAYQQGFPTYYIAEKVSARRKYAWVNADITKVGYKASFNRRFYDKYDKVVPVSEVLTGILSKSNFVNSSRLYPVFDILNVGLIREMASKQIIGEGINTIDKSNSLIIATVGRMVKLKGYDMAVDVARILKQKGMSFRWYFVGGGDQESLIRSKIDAEGLTGNIVMTGMQPNPYPYMAAADIYVQTSRFEGFGLTLNEARILHRPVISTNFPVVYDQIQDGVNGLIAEMNPESIAEKIMLLMENVELRHQLIEATKQEINTTAITEPKKVMTLLLS